MVDANDSLPVAFWASSIVTMVGWLIVFWFSTQAQKRNLRNQVLDRARGEIVKTIRENQRVLRAYISSIATLQLDIVLFWDRGTDLVPSGVSRLYDVAQDFALPRLDWAIQLEEYEILFPETRTVRGQLVHEQSLIYARVAELLQPHDLSAALKRDRDLADRTLAVLATLHMDFMDQSALTEDLRVHLQNAALGQITGRKLPSRVPTDPSLPRFSFDPQGQLHVFRLVEAERRRQIEPSSTRGSGRGAPGE